MRSCVQPSEPDQNAYIDASIGHARRHSAYRFDSLDEKVHESTADWIDRCNEVRPQDAPGSLPPAQYRKQLLEAETPVRTVYLRDAYGLSAIEWESGPRVRLACVVTSNRTPEETTRDLALLDEEERAVSDRFLLQADRRDHIAAHALARTLLSQERPEISPADWRFRFTPRGKPILAAPLGAHLGVSLSHTRGMVACAVVPDGEIGIDVECDDRQLTVRSLAREVCSDNEWRQLDAAPAEVRKALFLDLWTLKESYLKALGLGIADGALAEASFELGQLGVIQTELADQTPPWRFLMLRPTPTARIALAVRCLARPSLRALLHGPAGEALLHPVRSSFVHHFGR